MCSWCKQVKSPSGGWVEVDQALRDLGLLESEAPPRLTHGICPSCARLMQNSAKDA